MADILMRLGSVALVSTGPMDEALERLGYPADMALPMLNLTEPESVCELLNTYALSGAQCVLTNTMGATSSLLAHEGFAAYVAQVNSDGVKLAREADFTHVLACMGPCGITVEPGSGQAWLQRQSPVLDDALVAGDAPTGFASAVENYAEQAAALASGMPDAFFLHSFTDLDDIIAAVSSCRLTCDLPIIACIPCASAPLSCDIVAKAARALSRAGVSALGCYGFDLDLTLECLGVLRHEAPSLPLAAYVKVNAAPRVSPDACAIDAMRLVDAGACLVGFCGDATPACAGAAYAAVGGKQIS